MKFLKVILSSGIWHPLLSPCVEESAKTLNKLGSQRSRLYVACSDSSSFNVPQIWAQPYLKKRRMKPAASCPLTWHYSGSKPHLISGLLLLAAAVAPARAGGRCWLPLVKAASFIQGEQNKHVLTCFSGGWWGIIFSAFCFSPPTVELNEIGFRFVRKCINAIETNGKDSTGLILFN